MDGGKPTGATGDQEKVRRELTRRDFTRLGAVAGGLAWTAPKITTVRFAQKIVGSHVPNTTTTTETTASSTSTTTTTGTTSTTTSTSTTSTTLGPTGSSESTSTTGPPGSTGPTTTNTGPPVTGQGSTASTTTSSTPTTSTSVPTSTTEACKPGNGFGDKNHCHTGPPGHLGALSFTGADTVDLGVFGATAVVTGRMLYAFGRRAREEDADLDGDDDATPHI